jgi:hypothetical protein
MLNPGPKQQPVRLKYHTLLTTAHSDKLQQAPSNLAQNLKRAKLDGGLAAAEWAIAASDIT